MPPTTLQRNDYSVLMLTLWVRSLHGCVAQLAVANCRASSRPYANCRYFRAFPLQSAVSWPTMFFFRNKHIMIDLGTGNNNKINWALNNKQEMIDIVEVVYRGAKKGRGLVVSPKDYSTKYRY